MKLSLLVFGTWFLIYANANCVCPPNPNCSGLCQEGTECIRDKCYNVNPPTPVAPVEPLTTVTLIYEVTFTTRLGVDTINTLKKQLKEAYMAKYSLNTNQVIVEIYLKPSSNSNRMLLQQKLYTYIIKVIFKDIPADKAALIIAQEEVPKTSLKTISSSLEKTGVEYEIEKLGGDGAICCIWANIFCPLHLACVNEKDVISPSGICKKIPNNTTGKIGWVETTLRFKRMRDIPMDKVYFKYILKNSLMEFGTYVSSEYISVVFKEPKLTAEITLVSDQLLTTEYGLQKMITKPNSKKLAPLLSHLQNKYGSVFSSNSTFEISNAIHIHVFNKPNASSTLDDGPPDGVYWDSTLLLNAVLLMIFIVIVYVLMELSCFAYIKVCSCCNPKEKQPAHVQI